MKIVVPILVPVAGALLIASAVAQLPTMSIGGGGFAGQNYVGPGNINSGADAWVGFRGYNAAYSGNAAMICDLATGLTCLTKNIQPNGAMDLTGLSGAGPCSSTCIVATLFDQTGHGNNLTYGATLSQAPTFILNALNSHPCMQFVGSNSQRLFNTTGPTSAQSWSWAAVASASVATGSDGGVSGSFGTDIRISFRPGAPATFSFYAGGGGYITGPSAALGSPAYHRLQAFALNGTSSFAFADNVSGGTGTSPGTNAFSGWYAGSNFNADYLTGFICEQGIWPTNTSGNASTLDSNMKTYWGL